MKNTVQQAKRFISYLRVSTDKQGIRGLGMQAQRDSVENFIGNAGPNAVLLAEYVEVESGRRSNRPKLLEAIDHAQTAAAILVIAKLDRLSRDVHFLTGLERAGVEFIACDLPNANRLTITILAAVAEHERELISQRTKAALTVARARVSRTGQRGHPAVKRLGNPEGIKPMEGVGNTAAIAARRCKADTTARRLKGVFDAIQRDGLTTAHAIASTLNQRGILSPGGKAWYPTSVYRMLHRIRALKGNASYQ